MRLPRPLLSALLTLLGAAAGRAQEVGMLGGAFLGDRLYLGVGAGPHLDRDTDLLLMGLGYVW